MATTTNYGWTTPNDTDLVKDGAAAIRTLGSSVDTTTKALNPSTTLGDIEYRSSTSNTNTRLAIGTTGQVLSVVGGVPAWATSDDANAIQNAIVDAKGDLISATAADTPARLAVGANGTVLTADSTEATGLKWATPSGGGKVLQVVQGTNSTSQTTTSTTMVASNLSASITPTSATSKILIMITEPIYLSRAANSASSEGRLMRNGTQLRYFDPMLLGAFGGSSSSDIAAVGSITYLDSPATTSATTYNMEYKVGASAITLYLSLSNTLRNIILMEIGA